MRLSVFYKFSYVSKATTCLWIQNATGAQICLNIVIDLLNNSTFLIFSYILANISNIMFKAVTN